MVVILAESRIFIMVSRPPPSPECKKVPKMCGEQQLGPDLVMICELIDVVPIASNMM